MALTTALLADQKSDLPSDDDDDDDDDDDANDARTAPQRAVDSMHAALAPVLELYGEPLSETLPRHSPALATHSAGLRTEVMWCMDCMDRNSPKE